MGSPYLAPEMWSGPAGAPVWMAQLGVPTDWSRCCGVAQGLLGQASPQADGAQHCWGGSVLACPSGERAFTPWIFYTAVMREYVLCVSEGSVTLPTCHVSPESQLDLWSRLLGPSDSS